MNRTQLSRGVSQKARLGFPCCLSQNIFHQDNSMATRRLCFEENFGLQTSAYSGHIQSLKDSCFLRGLKAVFCSGCKSSFSILGNALLDFKELACFLYPLFLWCYTKGMLHFQKKEKAFMNVQTVVSSCECVCRHSHAFSRGRKVVYLHCLCWYGLFGCGVQVLMHKEGFPGLGLGENAGHALPCSQPQVWHVRRWVLLRWNFLVSSAP